MKSLICKTSLGTISEELTYYSIELGKKTAKVGNEILKLINHYLYLMFLLLFVSFSY